jgi:hypothetical protein
LASKISSPGFTIDLTSWDWYRMYDGSTPCGKEVTRDTIVDDIVTSSKPN